MKTMTGILALATGLTAATQTPAIEQAKYTVLDQQGDFELRDYQPQVLAEVVVEADVEEAGNKAFRKLFRYISGKNRTQAKIDMTAPVSQEARGEKIAMTAPVSQVPAEEGWAVSFMMPSSYALNTLPAPNDPDVALREVPARRMAAVRYSGTWGEKGYRKHIRELTSWMERTGIEADGDPVWARYDPPFKPWFMRRNEVMIPVRAP